MPNWFALQGGVFECVETPEGHVLVNELVTAAEGFTTLLDHVHVTGFSGVKARLDMRVRSIREARDRYKARTLHELIAAEAKAKQLDMGTACGGTGVLWFTRALVFVYHAFNTMLEDPGLTLRDAFRESYTKTLSAFHETPVKLLFELALRCSPTREAFFTSLAAGDPHARVDADERRYLRGMRRVSMRLSQFCQFKGWAVMFSGKPNDLFDREAVLARKRKREAEALTAAAKDAGGATGAPR